jgi:hypothetical protein
MMRSTRLAVALLVLGASALVACPGSETTPCGDKVCQKGFKCGAAQVALP